jgi:hypothetical protein
LGRRFERLFCRKDLWISTAKDAQIGRLQPRCQFR